MSRTVEPEIDVRRHECGGGCGCRQRKDRLGRALGGASLGLAAPLLLKPGETARAIGVADTPEHRSALTAVGARELAAAGGLLVRPNRFWLWSRVLGDAMDLAMLRRASRDRSSDARRTTAATAAVAGIAAVDLYAASRSRRRTRMELTATTTVGKPPQEVYDYWRDLENLPTFMAHLHQVRVTGERTSHWAAAAPLGRSVEWDAETTEDVPGERLAWRSVGKADVPNEGAVDFRAAPGGRGTEVHVRIAYDIPGGRLGKAVARYFGEEPHQQLDDDLRRLKQVLETGMVTRSDGAPYGKQARREFPQHAAQPLTRKELRKLTMEGEL